MEAAIRALVLFTMYLPRNKLLNNETKQRARPQSCFCPLDCLAHIDLKAKGKSTTVISPYVPLPSGFGLRTSILKRQGKNTSARFG